MKPEVGLDGVLRCGGRECVQRRLNRGAAVRVQPCGGQRRRLGLDTEPEVDHVQDVVMGANRRGLNGERGGRGNREHERTTALEGFDQSLGAEPRHCLPNDGSGYAELVDELGFRGQLVTGRQITGEDLVLQAGDDSLGQ